MSTAKQIAVIGIGSPFGADQLGWQVIEQLNHHPVISDNNVHLQSCDRPGTLLLDYLKGVDQAILVDAIEGGVYGNVQIINKTQLLQTNQPNSSHQIGVAESIALGEKLNLLPEQLVLIGIETGNPNDPATPETTPIHKLANCIAREIGVLIAKSKPETTHL